MQSIRNKIEGYLRQSSEVQEDKILRLLRADAMEGLPHSHQRTLREHLTGTRRVLRAWSQPAYIQMAGLCHSIYSTDRYHGEAISIDQRPHVRDIVGGRSENLTFLFSVTLRRSLFDQIEKLTSLGTDDQIWVKCRGLIGSEKLLVSGQDIADLLIVHLANLAEQAAGADGRPRIWLQKFIGLASNLTKFERHLPPVFSECKFELTSLMERELLDTYCLALTEFDDNSPLALKHFTHCTHICPYVAEPWVWKAYLEAEQGLDRDRKDSAKQAIAVLRDWGTAWDKRLRFEEWNSIAWSLLKGLANRNECQSLMTLAASEAKDAIRGLGAPEIDVDRGLHRFATYLNRIAVEKSRSAYMLYPGLNQREFHDPVNFSVVTDLESSFSHIVEEVKTLDRRAFHHEAESISRKGEWKVFMLYEAGRKIEGNCAFCPVITSIIERHDCVKRIGGLIYLSKLAAGAEVAAHRGPTNMRLRCHLGIEIPSGDCGLRVGQKYSKWQAGRCIIFDDYYEHEVWNRTDTDRIVLLVDLWHPELTTHERKALEAIQWFSYQQGMSLFRYWKKNDAQQRSEQDDASTHMVDTQLGELIDPPDH